MRGLLAIECLYHQIILGRKTQTRRSGGLQAVNENPDDWEETGSSFVNTKNGVSLESIDFCNYKRTLQNVTCKPRYKVGEVLYLKEPYERFHKHLHPNGFGYKFGVPDNYVANQFGRQTGFNDSVKWKNKLFMPADAGRNFIKITGIRCERLLDVNYSDAIAEGVESMGYHGYKDYLRKNTYELTAIESFLSLYKFANKVKEVPNLWVFCYEFEYLTNYQRWVLK